MLIDTSAGMQHKEGGKTRLERAIEEAKGMVDDSGATSFTIITAGGTTDIRISNSKDKDKVKKPYAYDCVIIDKMDEETYQEVIKAANHNLRSLASVCYKGGIIGYIVLLVFTVVVFINNIIGYFDAGNTFFNAIAGSINSTGVYFGFDVAIAFILVLVSIKYKKFKNQ